MKSKWWLALLALYTELVLGSGITPIEAMFRPFLKGPLMTLTASKSNQFAGRTTIDSGSATKTVSTSVVNSNSLISHQLQVALAAGYNTQGLINIVSGASTGVASTSAVYSGQAILITPRGVNVLPGGATRVHSIHEAGGSFTVAIQSATINSGCTLMWHIPAAEPVGLKVNTISPGNFFTFGWADGQSRPVDVTVMWEIRRAS